MTVWAWLKGYITHCSVIYLCTHLTSRDVSIVLEVNTLRGLWWWCVKQENGGGTTRREEWEGLGRQAHGAEELLGKPLPKLSITSDSWAFPAGQAPGPEQESPPRLLACLQRGLYFRHECTASPLPSCSRPSATLYIRQWGSKGRTPPFCAHGTATSVGCCCKNGFVTRLVTATSQDWQ